MKTGLIPLRDKKMERAVKKDTKKRGLLKPKKEMKDWTTKYYNN